MRAEFEQASHELRPRHGDARHEGDDESVAPVLVLALGNRLLADDGAGLVLLEALRAELCAEERAGHVEFLDGGTQGLALLGRLEGRAAVLLLDAASPGGGTPGSVHVLRDAVSARPRRGEGAHEGNAGELLSAALFLGHLPPDVVLVGIEPAELETRVGLSEPVEKALPQALSAARAELDHLLKRWEVTSCTK